MEKDIVLSVSSMNVDELRNTAEYKNVERQGEFKINIENDFCVVYSFGLATLFLLKDVPVINKKTKEEFILNGKIYHNDFYKGFVEGREHFLDTFIENKYQSKDTIVKTLHRYYHHEIIVKKYIGWKSFTKYTMPATLSVSIIKDWGFYSGIIFELKEFIKLHKELFKNFHECEINNTIQVIKKPQPPTTSKKAPSKPKQYLKDLFKNPKEDYSKIIDSLIENEFISDNNDNTFDWKGATEEPRLTSKTLICILTVMLFRKDYIIKKANTEVAEILTNTFNSRISAKTYGENFNDFASKLDYQKSLHFIN